MSRKIVKLGEDLFPCYIGKHRIESKRKITIPKLNLGIYEKVEISQDF